MTPLEQLEELKKEIIENDNCDDPMSAYDLAMSILPRAFDLGRREQAELDLKAVKDEIEDGFCEGHDLGDGSLGVCVACSMDDAQEDCLDALASVAPSEGKDNK